jgi:hypothetical protein
MAEDIRRAVDGQNQCSASTARGPCPNEAVQLPDDTFTENCKMHGGAWQARSAEKKRMFGYRLGKWQNKIMHHAHNPAAKSLRAEIGVLRVLLEERIQAIQDPIQLIAATGPCSTLVMQINTLVTSCDKLEQRQGVTLDKTQVMSLADQMLSVIFANLDSLDVDAEKTELFLAGVSEGIGNIFKEESDLDL